MREQDLIARHPLLFHVTDPAAWDSVVQHGLLSTSALLDLYGVTGEMRDAIEARPRDRDWTLSAHGLPLALIRDQKPLRSLRDTDLEDGLTVADWCRLLDRRVFLFTHESDARRLATAYRGQRVYAVATSTLIERHDYRIRLSAINTGYAMRRPARRGLRTFQPIEEFSGGVKEFTVEWAIPDFAELVAATAKGT